MKKQKNKLAGLQKRKALSGYLFIAPFIVGFLTFMVQPFCRSLYMSFCEVELAAGKIDPIWKGIANYHQAFRIDPEFTRLLWEEISRMVLYSIAIMVFSFFVALILNQKFKGRAFVRAIFFLPVILSSGVILGLESENSVMDAMNVAIEETAQGISITGALEQILRTAGVGTRAYEFVFEVIDNIYDIAIASGIQIIIFLSGLQTISSSMYEAADIDGATGIQKFFRVTLPLMCPSVKIIVVTGLIGGMKVFDIIYSMTSGGPGDATQTVMMVMMKKGISDGFYSTGSAFGVCFFVIVLAISAVVTKLMGKWSEAIQ